MRKLLHRSKYLEFRPATVTADDGCVTVTLACRDVTQLGSTYPLVAIVSRHPENSVAAPLKMVKRKAPAPPARENIAPVGADAGTVGECAPLHSPILGPADSAAPPLSELGTRLDALSNAFSRLGDREREAASGATVALANENSALRDQVQGAWVVGRSPSAPAPGALHSSQSL